MFVLILIFYILFDYVERKKKKREKILKEKCANINIYSNLKSILNFFREMLLLKEENSLKGLGKDLALGNSYDFPLDYMLEIEFLCSL